MNYLKGFIKLAFVLLVVFACIYSVNFPDLSEADFSKIIEIPTAQKIILLTLSILIFWLLGIQLKLTLKPYNNAIKNIDCVKISIANTMLNHLPAKAGLIFRGVYLKRFHKITYGNYGTSFIASNIIFISASSTIGLIFFITNVTFMEPNINNGSLLSAITLILLGVSTFGILLLSVPFPKIGLKNYRVVGMAQEFHKKIFEWKSKNSVVIPLTVTCAAVFITSAVRLFVCFYSFDTSTSLLNIIFIQACVSASVIFSITPGNLGLKEGVILSTATALGTPPEIAVLSALTDRAAAMIPTFILGPVSLALLRTDRPH